jgi:hypothetical protein
MENSDFVTSVDVEVDYASVKPQGFSYESHSSKTRIRYRMDIDFRSWGIHGISASLPEQKVDITLDMLPDGQEDYQDCSVEVQIVESEVEAERAFALNADICPQELQLTITEIKAVSDKSYVSFVAKAKAKLVF